MSQDPRQIPPSEVASVAVLRGGKLLWIRRRDTGKLTLPGGHLLPGEEPLDGARRELQEETGLTPEFLEYLGDGEAGAPGHPLRVHAFRCEDPNGGDPHPALDPDREAAAYEWRDPDDCPGDDVASVPNHRNITLIHLQLGSEAGDLQKAERGRKEWRARDGLRIPHHQDPDRENWDRAYLDKLVEVFGAGDPRRLRPVQVPITPYLTGTNPVKSQARQQLYQRMVAGGDRLPPIVVKRSGIGWHVIDGNHRADVALRAGLPHLDAYELLDADHPDLKKAGIEEILHHLERTRARVKEISATSQASSWRTKSGHTVVVARDPHARDRWRATRISPEGEPIGHEVAPSYEAALHRAHDQGADLHGLPLKMLKVERDLVAAATASLDDSLRRPKYQGNPNHLAGHCYVASEALYHMMGGPDGDWVPQVIRHENDTHWYLKHRESGEILDPTAGQFKTPVPYEKGRGSGFLTRQPSKRAQELINRIESRRALDRRPAGR